MISASEAKRRTLHGLERNSEIAKINQKILERSEEGYASIVHIIDSNEVAIKRYLEILGYSITIVERIANPLGGTRFVFRIDWASADIGDLND